MNCLGMPPEGTPMSKEYKTTSANTCASVDWYEGHHCVLAADHDGRHADDYGATWEQDASWMSAMRVHGPWWPERGHVVGAYLRNG